MEFPRTALNCTATLCWLDSVSEDHAIQMAQSRHRIYIIQKMYFKRRQARIYYFVQLNAIKFHTRTANFLVQI